MYFLSLAVATVVLTAAGPFGTQAITGIGWQLLFWGLVVLISTHLGVASTVLAEQWIAPDKPLLIDLTRVALVTLTFSPILWGLLFAVMGFDFEISPDFLVLMQYVAAVSVGVSVIRRGLSGTGGPGYFLATAPVVRQSPRLARRLPEEARKPILRLTVRDHFVDVVTAGATHTIRMRFSDAINEMDTVSGYCTHRSHWVAQEAIAEVVRCSGKTSLRLVNGDQVPVSRKFKSGLQEAGIL